MIEAFCVQKQRPIGDQKAVNYCFKTGCKHLRFCVRRAPKIKMTYCNHIAEVLYALLIIEILKNKPHDYLTMNLVVMIWNAKNGKRQKISPRKFKNYRPSKNTNLK